MSAESTKTDTDAVEHAIGACLSAHEYGSGNEDPEDGVLVAAAVIRALATERDALRDEIRLLTAEVQRLLLDEVQRLGVERTRRTRWSSFPSGVVRAVPGELCCPKCGAVETHPTEENQIVIRGLKVYDEHGAWSQCLRCSGLYSADLSTHDEENHDPAKGWFVT